MQQDNKSGADRAHLPDTVEPDKAAIVGFCQLAHQRRIAHHVGGQAAAEIKQYRETHGMNAHPCLTALVGAVQLPDRVDDGPVSIVGPNSFGRQCQRSNEFDPTVA